MTTTSERESDGGIGSSNWFCKIFRRKPKAKREREPAWWESDWKRVRELYTVGKQFDYLGRKMVVAQFKRDFNGIYAPSYPYMVCEYADDKGKLHEWCFMLQMMPLLLQNAELSGQPPKT